MLNATTRRVVSNHFLLFYLELFPAEKNQLNVMFLFAQAHEDALAKQEQLLTYIDRKKKVEFTYL